MWVGASHPPQKHRRDGDQHDRHVQHAHKDPGELLVLHRRQPKDARHLAVPGVDEAVCEADDGRKGVVREDEHHQIDELRLIAWRRQVVRQRVHDGPPHQHRRAEDGGVGVVVQQVGGKHHRPEHHGDVDEGERQVEVDKVDHGAGQKAQDGFDDRVQRHGCDEPPRQPEQKKRRYDEDDDHHGEHVGAEQEKLAQRVKRRDECQGQDAQTEVEEQRFGGRVGAAGEEALSQRPRAQGVEEQRHKGRGDGQRLEPPEAGEVHSLF